MNQDFWLVFLSDGEAPDEMNTRLVGPLPPEDDERCREVLGYEGGSFGITAVPFEEYYREIKEEEEEDTA